jgi:hypothetical protein
VSARPHWVPELARQLVAATPPESNADPRSGTLINENFRLSLTRFAGKDGFNSLLRRSVALVGASFPPFRGATVGPDDRIEGLNPTGAADDELWREAAIAVTAQLLELLVTFIGEPLTRRLVREACPELPSDD